ncbi:MAG TPA: hypothetical protein VN622_08495 [Clostridia bacterium]|nr:hypothetical protein [Clostridia bacterium]
MTAAMKLPENIKEYFRKQGEIGAAKRHANLTAEERSQIARKAAQERWAKATTKKGSEKKQRRDK